MTNTEKAINLIEWLINKSGITANRIGTDTGLSVTTIDRIKKQGKPTENITLRTAMKLEAYAMQIQKQEVDKMNKNPMEMVQHAKNARMQNPNLDFIDLMPFEEKDYAEYHQLISEFGGTKKGEKLAFLQNPYISGEEHNPHYTTSAVDIFGNHYNVIWDMKEDWEELVELGDDGLLCDWDNPASVEMI